MEKKDPGNIWMKKNPTKKKRLEWKKDKAGVISCSYKQYFIPHII